MTEMQAPAPAEDAAPPDAGRVWPPVSVVMPVLDEEAHLATAVRHILAQTYAGPLELVIALGPSRDGTDRVARELAAADPRITLVRNPSGRTPAGLNAAVRAARHDIIARVDGHGLLLPGYVERAVELLQSTGAANVGGLMLAVGVTGFEQAVARAYSSRVGLGGGRFHVGGEEGPADTVYLGVFRRDVLDRLGGYDEHYHRAQDWELNLRIRRAGHKVWFDPTLVVTYWPRESLSKLVRQFLATGIWRGELVRRHGGRNPIRFFIPPALLLSIVVSLVVAVLQLTGMLSGLGALVASVVYLGPIAYAFLLVLLMFTPDGGTTWGDRLRFLVVLPTMHLAWGMGFLIGLVRGAQDALDTSRLD